MKLLSFKIKSIIVVISLVVSTENELFKRKCLQASTPSACGMLVYREDTSIVTRSAMLGSASDVIQNIKKVNDPMKTLPSEIQERIVDRLTGKSSHAIGNENISYIWDFAGQQLYYNTHLIFFTSEAVYILLFNLMESMYAKGKGRVSKMSEYVMTCDMTNIEIIKYWMRLIYTYAVPVVSQPQQHLQAMKPQIVVVGTHGESLQGTYEEKTNKIQEQYSIIFEEIKGTPYECHVVRKMYAIDNKYPSQNDMLQTLKQDVGGFLKSMPKTIPLKWLEFQRILQEIGKDVLRMSYAQVCEVASKCGISVKSLIHTLNYLHDLGIILYFENHRLLKDTVITNPRKLIDIFRKIITVVEPDDIDKWASMIVLWNKLDDEGILEEKLLRHLWRDELNKDEGNFEVLLELMKQFGLLCEQIKNEEGSHRSFFVPCRLKLSDNSMDIQPDTDQMVSICMASEDFLPDSIFHTLVVSLIGMVQDMGYTVVPQLYRNMAVIHLGYDHLLRLGQIVINNKLSLKLEISRIDEVKENGTVTSTEEPSPRVCMQVLEFLQQEIKVLTSRMKRTGYRFRVLCWTNLQEIHFHDLEECLQNSFIRCGKQMVTTSKLQRLFRNMKPFTDDRLGYLKDKDLFLIASGIGLYWKQLGVKLGLSWNRIQQIWSDNRLRSPDCIMAMLTEWRKQQNYETNQVEIMCSAMSEQGLHDLANNVFSSQPSEYQPSQVRENAGERLHRTPRQHHGQLTDIDMQFVATRLGKDWKTFGRILGLKQHELDQIEMELLLPTVDCILEMLVKWRERQNSKVNHLQKISEALIEIGRMDINDELQQYYLEII
ncbi:uncharacterized protein LOC117120467 [Anneissia japonica]|uniref:uncharacterized protein LOC117120467 n=1 Tax=Anneissia japonica TaxID=1529436 RepID=UPI00142559AA|nr:uncharacterized protein LOC117120467 [Anneissia japonica]